MVLFMMDNHCDLFKVSASPSPQLCLEPAGNVAPFNPPDSCFTAPAGQQQNHEHGEREGSGHGSRLEHLDFPPSVGCLEAQLVSLNSPDCRYDVLHQGQRRGLRRNRSKDHQRGTLVPAADDPREPQILLQGEEAPAGPVLQRPPGDLCSVLWEKDIECEQLVMLTSVSLLSWDVEKKKKTLMSCNI